MTGDMRVTFYWVWQSLSLAVLTIVLLGMFLRTRHLSLNLWGSQEVSKEPYRCCVPLWSQAGWSSLSFQHIKNFVLNQSSFSQSFIKTNISLPKASLSQNEQFSETSIKAFSVNSLLSLMLSAFHSHIPMREAKRFVSHFVGQLESSGRLICDPLGGNGQALVSSSHITRSELLNVLVP